MSEHYPYHIFLSSVAKLFLVFQANPSDSTPLTEPASSVSPSLHVDDPTYFEVNSFKPETAEKSLDSLTNANEQPSESVMK
ncbi:hypothetical protein KIN20_001344 [Parelaphostrongylus tenuis]|uniref:Uncharacterized protein n=1 Tax=Parelaphostrongylus tenuis TaxID=148309 RepID=A0AAD5LY16_PARTN|nr:hypothetical protein KIN20_001344 [Parelaphostrongylus tenuis]